MPRIDNPWSGYTWLFRIRSPLSIDDIGLTRGPVRNLQLHGEDLRKDRQDRSRTYAMAVKPMQSSTVQPFYDQTHGQP